MSSTTCPVFYPSLEEFRDFRKYIEWLSESEAAAIGICKVVPPRGWFERDYDINTIGVKIETPVKQRVIGRAGVYEVQLLEMKPMSVADMAKYSDDNSFYEPSYEEREKRFWKNIGSSNGIWKDPIYGADILGSLFQDKDACGWNLNRLDSILTDIGAVIPGVNCGYLYFGCWRSMFAYHTEDYDLFSVNYVHHGAAKSWYSIPPASRKLFESMAVGYFRSDFNACKEYLRHKTKMFSPSILREHGISFNTVLQQAGEFVITFPGSYHAGFNHGFNIAEATNFASVGWFDIGRKAKYCLCRPNAVRLDIDFLETMHLRKRFSAVKAETNAQPPPLQRLRCSCGDRKSVVGDENTQICCCSLCRLHYHPQCNEKLFVSVNMPHALKTAVDIQLCHACAFLEVQSQQSQHGTSEANGSIHSTTTAEEDIGPEYNEAFIQGLKIGSEVSAFVAGQIFPVCGSISHIEDGFGRIHVKGQRRDRDVWVALDMCMPPKSSDPSSPSSPSSVKTNSSQSPSKFSNVKYVQPLSELGGPASPKETQLAGQKRPPPAFTRGSYTCSKCGKPKANHICEFPSVKKVAKASEEPVNAACPRCGGIGSKSHICGVSLPSQPTSSFQASSSLLVGNNAISARAPVGSLRDSSEKNIFEQIFEHHIPVLVLALYRRNSNQQPINTPPIGTMALWGSLNSLIALLNKYPSTPRADSDFNVVVELLQTIEIQASLIPEIQAFCKALLEKVNGAYTGGDFPSHLLLKCIRRLVSMSISTCPTIVVNFRK